MQTRFCIVFILMLAVTASSAWAAQTCGTNSITPTTGHLAGKTDGTVADSKTKLMWKRCPEGFDYQSATNSCASTGTTAYTWDNALNTPAAANTANFAGYNNWRMPNIKELQSIVEEQCYNPAVNTDRFPSVSSVSYIWSNSPADPNKIGDSYLIDFYYGDVFYTSRASSTYTSAIHGISNIGVRLVRDCGIGECD